MKLLTALCAAFVLTVSAVCQGQTAPDNLPDGVVVLVEAANPAHAWQDLQGTAGAVVAGSQLPPLAGLAGKLVSTKDPSTMDLNGSIQLAFPAASLTDPSACALVFHVADVKAYLDSLAPGMQKVRDDGDLAIYGEAPSEIAIGSAGKRIVMGRGAAGEKAAAEVLSLLKAGHWPEKAIAGEDDIAVAVRPAGLLKALSAQGKDPFAAMKSGMQRSMQTGGGQPSGPMEGVVAAEVDLVQDMLQQCDTFVLTASFSADDVVLKNRMRFVPGGSISACLAGLPPGKLQLQRFIPADAMGAVVGKVGDMSALLKAYEGFLRKMAEAWGADKAGADAIVKFAQDMVGVMGHEVAEAGVLNPDGTMCLVYAGETTDPAAMQQLFDSMPALLAHFSGPAPGMPKIGMTASAEPIVYKDHKITEWTYSFEFRPVPGVPNAEAMAAMQQKMIEAMYGTEMKAYGTFLGKTWLMAYGSGALDRMKATIDGEATGEGSKRLEAAAAGMSGDQDVVGYLSLTDAARWYLRLLSTMLPQFPLPIDLKTIEFAKAPDVGISARMAGKDLAEAQVRVPTAAIKSLVEGAMTAYAKAAAAQRAPTAPKPSENP